MSSRAAKTFEYAVSTDRAGRISAEGGAPATLGDEWSPDHLLLAALLRCSIDSLRFHARREGLDLVAAGSASGTVTRRESDGRYAFVEHTCRIDVEFDPEPEDVDALFAKAERDCFVGASLALKPTYLWRVV